MTRTNQKRHARGTRGAGQWATEARTEPMVHLDGHYPLPYERTLEQAQERMQVYLLSRGATPEAAERNVAGITARIVKATPEGTPPAFVLDVMVDATEQPDLTQTDWSDVAHREPLSSDFARQVGDAYHNGMPVTWLQTMRERGPGWTRACVRRWNEGLTEHNLSLLDKYQLAQSSYAAMVFNEGDPATIRRVLDAFKGDPQRSRYLSRMTDRQLAHLSAMRGDPVEKLNACMEQNIEPSQLATGVEATGGARGFRLEDVLTFGRRIKGEDAPGREA